MGKRRQSGVIETRLATTDIELIAELLDEGEEVHSLGFAPWSDYPYKPAVKFKVGNTPDEIVIKIYVNEKSIAAKYSQPNDPVYRDSCFEFFISPDNNKYYYNFEFNCIGTPYLAYGLPGPDRAKADLNTLNLIRTFSTLGNKPFAAKNGEFQWEMTIVIPFAAFFKHDIKDPDGLCCKANFYKCGDDLAQPHFLSWNNIITQQPDFHRPDFFGDLKFR